MPTRLPTRSFLRRYAPEPETARNLKATAAEFGFALMFVTAIVVVIHLAATGGARLSGTPSAAPVATIR